MEQERKEMRNDDENFSPAIKILYEGLIKDKNKDLDELNKSYEQNIEKIKNEYIENIISTNNEKYFAELFKDIQNDISKIIKQKNNKKVNFDL